MELVRRYVVLTDGKYIGIVIDRSGPTGGQEGAWKSWSAMQLAQSRIDNLPVRVHRYCARSMKN